MTSSSTNVIHGFVFVYIRTEVYWAWGNGGRA